MKEIRIIVDIASFGLIIVAGANQVMDNTFLGLPLIFAGGLGIIKHLTRLEK